MDVILQLEAGAPDVCGATRAIGHDMYMAEAGYHLLTAAWNLHTTLKKPSIEEMRRPDEYLSGSYWRART